MYNPVEKHSLSIPDSCNIVYHGTNVVILHPSVDANRHAGDFGFGFYLTSSYKNAFSRADDRAYDTGKAVVMYYSMFKDLSNFNVKVFNQANPEWLDFIVDCKINHLKYDYDIVIGPTADARTVQILSDYNSRRNKIVNKRILFDLKRKTLQRLNSYSSGLSNQICIHTEHGLLSIRRVYTEILKGDERKNVRFSLEIR